MITTGKSILNGDTVVTMSYLKTFVFQDAAAIFTTLMQMMPGLPSHLGHQNLDGIGADEALLKLCDGISIKRHEVDAGATYDWEQAAFGLLSNSGTDASEVIRISWRGWCCIRQLPSQRD